MGHVLQVESWLYIVVSIDCGFLMAMEVGKGIEKRKSGNK